MPSLVHTTSDRASPKPKMVWDRSKRNRKWSGTEITDDACSLFVVVVRKTIVLAVTPKRRPRRLQTVQTVQTEYFFSYSSRHIYLLLTFFGSNNDKILINSSKCLLFQSTSRTSSVSDCLFKRYTLFGKLP